MGPAVQTGLTALPLGRRCMCFRLPQNAPMAVELLTTVMITLLPTVSPRLWMTTQLLPKTLIPTTESLRILRTKEFRLAVTLAGTAKALLTPRLVRTGTLVVI